MSRRRSRLEMVLDALRAVRSGLRKPTHIMYRANLSWDKLQRILRCLVSAGLVTDHVTVVRKGIMQKVKYVRHEYEITEGGKCVVDAYTDILAELKLGNAKLRR